MAYFCRYDAAGRLAKQVIYSYSDQDSTWRTLWRYDAAGRDTLQISQNWIAGGWRDTTRRLHVYDAEGNLMLEETLERKPGQAGFKIDYGTKYTYLRDAQNRVIERHQYRFADDSGRYTIRQKQYLRYTGTATEHDVQEEYYLSANRLWLPIEKFTGITWRNYAKRYMKDYLKYTGSSIYFQFEERMRTQMLSPTEYISVIDSMRSGSYPSRTHRRENGDSIVVLGGRLVQGAWNPSSKNVTVTDSFGTVTRSLYFTFTNGFWQPQITSIESYSIYEPVGGMRYVFRRLYNRSGVLQNLSYTRFWHFTAPASIPSYAVYSLTVSPNPSSKILNLNTTGRLEDLRIVDAQGRLCPASLEGNRIDVSGLKPGIYRLQVLVDGKPHHARFVKGQ